MPLSDEGVRILSKIALVTVVIFATAFARTVVGSNPKRHVRMALGTVGGVAAGMAIGPWVSALVGADARALTVVGCVFAGWAIAYQFAKRLPRLGPSQPTPWHRW